MRLTHAPRPEEPLLDNPYAVDRLLRPRIAHEEREHFLAVLVDTKTRPLAAPVISVGTLSRAPVHPREVFRPAMRAGAASLILAHNHPSGDPTPSREDVATTNRLFEVGRDVVA